MEAQANAWLVRALALSQDMLTDADRADFAAVALLDAERLQLLKSFRLQNRHVAPADQALLQQISQLNDRTLGLLEHHRRSKGREMDMAAVGRRAVAAYSSHA
jgi:hypothetical protein